MLLSSSIYFEFFLSKSTDEIQAELYMPIFTNNYYSDGYIESKKKKISFQRSQRQISNIWWRHSSV
ncbi:hypothetical protein MGQ_03513 [Candida albicans P76067]|nr:hypothetical protein MGQ_03513 [Candida albicans P76067]KHC62402.1 hypothetical protein MGE_03514 [Candida albicans P75010]